MSMRAMIFAAGMGTRLKPLTDHCPKALVKANGRPLIDHVLQRLIAAGCTHVVLNVHHWAEQMYDYFNTHTYPLQLDISDESDALLDTGGGLMKAAKFFKGSEPILIHNVDVISNIDLVDLYQQHIDSGALATLAVRDRQTSRKFLFDAHLRMIGWCHQEQNQVRWVAEPRSSVIALAFSGIHVIHPALFELETRQGAFSVVDTYLDIASKAHVQAYDHSSDAWFDLGKLEQLRLAEQWLLEHS